MKPWAPRDRANKSDARAGAAGNPASVSRGLPRQRLAALRRCALLGFCLVGWTPAQAQIPASATNRLVLSVPTDFWLQAGEDLRYRIYWGRIPVGTTRVWCEWTAEEGRRLLAVRYRTLSNKIVATLYPVDDTIEALIDPATFTSVRFTKNLSEGRHRYHEVTTFDYTNLVAHWESKISRKTKTLPLKADTRDLVAFMYLLRSRPFHSGEVIEQRVMADDKPSFCI
jgi:hypothetical protein